MGIRDAIGVDLAAIDEIYNHFVLTSTATFQVAPTTPEERRAWFATHGPEHPVIVFEEDDDDVDSSRRASHPGPRVAGGRILGWASLNPYHAREAYQRTVQDSVFVRHDRHRRGVGRQLMTELLTRAKSLGHHVVLAHIAADQAASVELHRRLGFAHAGRLREVGFKFNRWLDVAIMDLVLPRATPTAGTSKPSALLQPSQ